MRMILVLGLGLGLLVGLVACDKDGGGTAAAGSGAAPSGGSGSKTSLTKEQIDAAYTLCDPDKVDDSVKKVTAKLGAPQKTEGDMKIWYGAGKDACYQLRVGKTKGIDSGTTDKANCGMK
ncbi:MAG: hypothetical protein ABI193_04330 [Minicystis sp.]